MICINPGTIVKGEAAGSYASITIDPPNLSSADAMVEEAEKRALERIRVDIVNV